MNEKEDGFAQRLTRFARVSAGLTGVAARGAARSLSGTAVFSAKNAADLTQVLGSLRGPVMKVAQIMATIPDAGTGTGRESFWRESDPSCLRPLPPGCSTRKHAPC